MSKEPNKKRSGHNQMNKACWVAREQKNGWKLLYCEDRNSDVEIDFLFKDEWHINYALSRAVVFVHMDKTANGFSNRTKSVLKEHNLTPSMCSKMSDSKLLSLKNFGKMTLQEIRNRRAK